MDLEKSRVLVTGGSEGIGYAVAAALIERGARVVINGRDAGHLHEAAGRLGAGESQGDVGIEDDARRIVRETVAQLGGIDALINNAGFGYSAPLEELDADRFAAVWRTNVWGAALMARESLPHLKDGGGTIVNISSTAGLKGYARGSAYVATKFALRGMTQCWQAELRPHDIRVVLINPSEVQTTFGGRPHDRPISPHKLVATDIADAVVSALEMHDRGFIPELTVFATNPWKDA